MFSKILDSLLILNYPPEGWSGFFYISVIFSILIGFYYANIISKSNRNSPNRIFFVAIIFFIVFWGYSLFTDKYIHYFPNNSTLNIKFVALPKPLGHCQEIEDIEDNLIIDKFKINNFEEWRAASRSESCYIGSVFSILITAFLLWVSFFLSSLLLGLLGVMGIKSVIDEFTKE